MRLGAMLIAACWAATAFAQEVPKDAESAVGLARAAFEFRDFQKVVDILGPWVRPMKILDPKLKIEARSLTGVSLHLLGRIDEAKVEFGDLLLLDPKHQLDPFVVPPEVIATFEAVRKELKPTLDQILEERGELPIEEPPINLKVVTTPHPAIALFPFGIPQFVMNETGWGAAFAVVQTLGLTTNIGGWVAALRAGRMSPNYETWLAIEYAGLAATVLAYVANLIHSFILVNSQQAEVPPTP